MTDASPPSMTLLEKALKDSGATLAPGLSEVELATVEARFGFALAPDHRVMLSIALPTGDAWPDWRDGDHADLQGRLDWPIDSILFDVKNGFWREAWGERPADMLDAVTIAKKNLQQAPVLVPLFSHRYVPTSPSTPGNAVLSCYQTDIIYYGHDLLDWFACEFHGRRMMQLPARRVPFWSDLMDEGYEW